MPIVPELHDFSKIGQRRQFCERLRSYIDETGNKASVKAIDSIVKSVGRMISEPSKAVSAKQQTKNEANLTLKVVECLTAESVLFASAGPKLACSCMQHVANSTDHTDVDDFVAELMKTLRILTRSKLLYSVVQKNSLVQFSDHLVSSTFAPDLDTPPRPKWISLAAKLLTSMVQGCPSSRSTSDWTTPFLDWRAMFTTVVAQVTSTAPVLHDGACAATLRLLLALIQRHEERLYEACVLHIHQLVTWIADHFRTLFDRQVRFVTADLLLALLRCQRVLATAAYSGTLHPAAFDSSILQHNQTQLSAGLLHATFALLYGGSGPEFTKPWRRLYSQLTSGLGSPPRSTTSGVHTNSCMLLTIIMDEAGSDSRSADADGVTLPSQLDLQQHITDSNTYPPPSAARACTRGAANSNVRGDGISLERFDVTSGSPATAGGGQLRRSSSGWMTEVTADPAVTSHQALQKRAPAAGRMLGLIADVFLHQAALHRATLPLPQCAFRTAAAQGARTLWYRFISRLARALTIQVEPDSGDDGYTTDGTTHDLSSPATVRRSHRQSMLRTMSRKRKRSIAGQSYAESPTTTGGRGPAPALGQTRDPETKPQDVDGCYKSFCALQGHILVLASCLEFFPWLTVPAEHAHTLLIASSAVIQHRRPASAINHGSAVFAALSLACCLLKPHRRARARSARTSGPVHCQQRAEKAEFDVQELEQLVIGKLKESFNFWSVHGAVAPTQGAALTKWQAERDADAANWRALLSHHLSDAKAKATDVQATAAAIAADKTLQTLALEMGTGVGAVGLSVFSNLQQSIDRQLILVKAYELLDDVLQLSDDIRSSPELSGCHHAIGQLDVLRRWSRSELKQDSVVGRPSIACIVQPSIGAVSARTSLIIRMLSRLEPRSTASVLTDPALEVDLQDLAVAFLDSVASGLRLGSQHTLITDILRVREHHHKLHASSLRARHPDEWILTALRQFTDVRCASAALLQLTDQIRTSLDRAQKDSTFVISSLDATTMDHMTESAAALLAACGPTRCPQLHESELGVLVLSCMVLAIFLDFELASQTAIKLYIANPAQGAVAPLLESLVAATRLAEACGSAIEDWCRPSSHDGRFYSAVERTLNLKHITELRVQVVAVAFRLHVLTLSMCRHVPHSTALDSMACFRICTGITSAIDALRGHTGSLPNNAIAALCSATRVWQIRLILWAGLFPFATTEVLRLRLQAFVPAPGEEKLVDSWLSECTRLRDLQYGTSDYQEVFANQTGQVAVRTPTATTGVASGASEVAQRGAVRERTDSDDSLRWSDDDDDTMQAAPRHTRGVRSVTSLYSPTAARPPQLTTRPEFDAEVCSSRVAVSAVQGLTEAALKAASSILEYVTQPSAARSALAEAAEDLQSTLIPNLQEHDTSRQLPQAGSLMRQVRHFLLDVARQELSVDHFQLLGATLLSCFGLSLPSLPTPTTTVAEHAGGWSACAAVMHAACDVCAGSDVIKVGGWHVLVYSIAAMVQLVSECCPEAVSAWKLAAIAADGALASQPELLQSLWMQQVARAAHAASTVDQPTGQTLLQKLSALAIHGHTAQLPHSPMGLASLHLTELVISLAPLELLEDAFVECIDGNMVQFAEYAFGITATAQSFQLAQSNATVVVRFLRELLVNFSCPEVDQFLFDVPASVVDGFHQIHVIRSVCQTGVISPARCDAELLRISVGGDDHAEDADDKAESPASALRLLRRAAACNLRVPHDDLLQDLESASRVSRFTNLWMAWFCQGTSLNQFPSVVFRTADTPALLRLTCVQETIVPLALFHASRRFLAHHDPNKAYVCSGKVQPPTSVFSSHKEKAVYGGIDTVSGLFAELTAIFRVRYAMTSREQEHRGLVEWVEEIIWAHLSLLKHMDSVWALVLVSRYSSWTDDHEAEVSACERLRNMTSVLDPRTVGSASDVMIDALVYLFAVVNRAKTLLNKPITEPAHVLQAVSQIGSRAERAAAWTADPAATKRLVDPLSRAERVNARGHLLFVLRAVLTKPSFMPDGALATQTVPQARFFRKAIDFAKSDVAPGTCDWGKLEDDLISLVNEPQNPEEDVDEPLGISDVLIRSCAGGKLPTTVAGLVAAISHACRALLHVNGVKEALQALSAITWLVHVLQQPQLRDYPLMHPEVMSRLVECLMATSTDFAMQKSITGSLVSVCALFTLQRLLQAAHTLTSKSKLGGVVWISHNRTYIIAALLRASADTSCAANPPTAGELSVLHELSKQHERRRVGLLFSVLFEVKERPKSYRFPEPIRSAIAGVVNCQWLISSSGAINAVVYLHRCLTADLLTRVMRSQPAGRDKQPPSSALPGLVHAALTLPSWRSIQVLDADSIATKYEFQLGSDCHVQATIGSLLQFFRAVPLQRSANGFCLPGMVYQHPTLHTLLLLHLRAISVACVESVAHASVAACDAPLCSCVVQATLLVLQHIYSDMVRSSAPPDDVAAVLGAARAVVHTTTPDESVADTLCIEELMLRFLQPSFAPPPTCAHPSHFLHAVAADCTAGKLAEDLYNSPLDFGSPLQSLSHSTADVQELGVLYPGIASEATSQLLRGEKYVGEHKDGADDITPLSKLRRFVAVRVLGLVAQTLQHRLALRSSIPRNLNDIVRQAETAAATILRSGAGVVAFASLPRCLQEPLCTFLPDDVQACRVHEMVDTIPRVFDDRAVDCPQVTNAEAQFVLHDTTWSCTGVMHMDQWLRWVTPMQVIVTSKCPVVTAMAPLCQLSAVIAAEVFLGLCISQVGESVGCPAIVDGDDEISDNTHVLCAFNEIQEHLVMRDRSAVISRAVDHHHKRQQYEGLRVVALEAAEFEELVHVDGYWTSLTGGAAQEVGCSVDNSSGMATRPPRDAAQTVDSISQSAIEQVLWLQSSLFRSNLSRRVSQLLHTAISDGADLHKTESSAVVAWVVALAACMRKVRSVVFAESNTVDDRPAIVHGLLSGASLVDMRTLVSARAWQTELFTGLMAAKMPYDSAPDMCLSAFPNMTLDIDYMRLAAVCAYFGFEESAVMHLELWMMSTWPEGVSRHAMFADTATAEETASGSYLSAIADGMDPGQWVQDLERVKQKSTIQQLLSEACRRLQDTDYRLAVDAALMPDFMPVVPRAIIPVAIRNIDFVMETHPVEQEAALARLTSWADTDDAATSFAPVKPGPLTALASLYERPHNFAAEIVADGVSSLFATSSTTTTTAVELSDTPRVAAAVNVDNSIAVLAKQWLALFGVLSANSPLSIDTDHLSIRQYLADMDVSVGTAPGQIALLSRLQRTGSEQPASNMLQHSSREHGLQANIVQLAVTAGQLLAHTTGGVPMEKLQVLTLSALRMYVGAVQSHSTELHHCNAYQLIVGSLVMHLLRRVGLLTSVSGARASTPGATELESLLRRLTRDVPTTESVTGLSDATMYLKASDAFGDVISHHLHRLEGQYGLRGVDEVVAREQATAVLDLARMAELHYSAILTQQEDAADSLLLQSMEAKQQVRAA